MWALTYAELVKKIYLFGCNPEWLQALQKTFELWRKFIVVAGTMFSFDIEFTQMFMAGEHVSKITDSLLVVILWLFMYFLDLNNRSGLPGDYIYNT